MREMSLAPPSSSIARSAPTYTNTEAMRATTKRVASEIDALWQLTETLAALVANPVAALELVTRTAGELTAAEAAAILLHPGHELVLASRWGIVSVPLGYKSPDVRRTLDATWQSTASMPIRSGTHDVGCIWVARTGAAFSAEEQRVLRTLASITSLALPTLVDAKRMPVEPAEPAEPAAPAAPVEPAVVEAKRMEGAQVENTAPRLLPESMRAAALPSALARLLRALDRADEIDAIAALVANDPGLSTLLLRAGGRTRVREAIVFLGMQRVRTFALARFIRSLVDPHGPLGALLWEQVVGTSVRTRHLMRALDTHLDGDATRLTGLLHPLGSIALAVAHPDAWEQVLRTSITEDRPIDEVERAIFGVEAATLTGELVHVWHLEPALGSLAHGSTQEPVASALAWATHTTLVANPIWQRVHRRRSPGWVARRIAQAAEALRLDDDLLATVTVEADAALGWTRRLFAGVE